MAVTDEVIPINSVLGFIKPEGDPAYYTPEFKQMVEDHLSYMMSYRGNTEADVLVTRRQIGPDEKQKQLRYLGDWYGFLNSLSIDQRYFWVILRLNGTRDPLSLQLEMSSYLYPDTVFIDKLARLCKEKRA